MRTCPCELAAARDRGRRLQEQFRHADHAIHRRADLVTHVCEEGGSRDIRCSGGFLRDHQLFERGSSTALSERARMCAFADRFCRLAERRNRPHGEN